MTKQHPSLSEFDWIPGIVARKRTAQEVRDLAMRALFRDFKSTAFYFCVLAVPVLLVDYWILAQLSDFWFDRSFFSGDNFGGGDDLFNDDKDAAFLSLFRYFFATGWTTWFLITLETGFVGSLATEYLGIRLFADDKEIRKKRVFKSWTERAFQIFYYLVLTRVIRFGAFYPEVILLERHPFLGGRERLSTSRRVRKINSGGVSVEQFFFFLATEFYVFVGVLFGFGMFLALASTFLGSARLAFLFSFFFIYPPLVMASKLYDVVLHFYSYVNYRIKFEGWDIELTFRAELAKLNASDDDPLASGNGVAARARPRPQPLGALVLDAISTETNAPNGAAEASGSSSSSVANENESKEFLAAKEARS